MYQHVKKEAGMRCMVVFYKKWQKLQKALHTKVAQTSFGNAPQSWNLAKS